MAEQENMDAYEAEVLLQAFDKAIADATEIIAFAENAKKDLLRQDLSVHNRYIILSYAKEKAHSIERRFSTGSDVFYRLLDEKVRD
jgi:hypothetical protein